MQVEGADKKVNQDVFRSLHTSIREVVLALKLPTESSEPGGEAYFQDGDITHKLDLYVNKHLVAALERCGLPVLSEEALKNQSDEWVPEGLYFLIDPIDGTYNLWRGLPFVATSVALMNGEKPVLGVIRNLTTGDIYEGGILLPAQKNGDAISVSNVDDPQQAALATGIPVGTNGADHAQGGKLRPFGHPGKVRMFGSAALSLCLLAEGKVDIYSEAGIFLWDVAAGLAIAQAAGARISVSHFEGGYRREVKVTNACL